MARTQVQEWELLFIRREPRTEANTTTSSTVPDEPRHAMLRWRTLRFVLASLTSLLLGCTSVTEFKPSEIKPSVGHLPELIRVPQAVAYCHNSLLGDKPRISKVGLGEIVFPIGPPSAALFESIYPKVFTRAVKIKRCDSPEWSTRRVAGLFKPQIEAFRFKRLARGGYEYQWAMVSYRFSIEVPGAEPTVTWRVTGENEMSARHGTWSQPETATVERAMEDAAEKFMMSFFFVPEAKRWMRGLPLDGATAPKRAQELRTTEVEKHPIVIGKYNGVVAVTLKAVETLIPEKGPSIPFATRLSVTNEGKRQLFVRRADITIERPDGSLVRPVSASRLALLMTPYLGRAGPPPPFSLQPAYFGAANLFGLLVNLAAQSAEAERIAQILSPLRERELKDAKLKDHEEIEGVVYFDPSDKKLWEQDLSLIVPVIDLDSATRYIVRLPLKESEKR